MIEIFKTRFIKHLDDLEYELLQFNQEIDLWRTSGTITNTSGNLALHLIGNLNHFVGAQLGGTGYIRQRDKEFTDKNVDRSSILDNLRMTRHMIEKTFDGMHDQDLNKIYQLTTFGENKTVLEVLVFLSGHFNYHLGQINYLRRVLETVPL